MANVEYNPVEALIDSATEALPYSDRKWFVRRNLTSRRGIEFEAAIIVTHPYETQSGHRSAQFSLNLRPAGSDRLGRAIERIEYIAFLDYDANGWAIREYPYPHVYGAHRSDPWLAVQAMVDTISPKAAANYWGPVEEEPARCYSCGGSEKPGDPFEQDMGGLIHRSCSR